MLPGTDLKTGQWHWPWASILQGGSGEQGLGWWEAIDGDDGGFVGVDPEDIAQGIAYAEQFGAVGLFGCEEVPEQSVGAGHRPLPVACAEEDVAVAGFDVFDDGGHGVMVGWECGCWLFGAEAMVPGVWVSDGRDARATGELDGRDARATFVLSGSASRATGGGVEIRRRAAAARWAVWRSLAVSRVEA